MYYNTGYLLVLGIYSPSMYAASIRLVLPSTSTGVYIIYIYMYIQSYIQHFIIYIVYMYSYIHMLNTNIYIYIY